MEKLSWKSWKKEGDKHLINRIQWDEAEINAIIGVFKEDWFGHGSVNDTLQNQLASFTNIPYYNLTNSGSAAIEVAVQTLIQSGKLSVGDKILHPVTTFPTSISSAIRAGLIPVFVETKPKTYVIDPELVEKTLQIHPDIKAAIIPHLLGNIPNMKRIKTALNNRPLIEDACDTLGGTYAEKHLGTHGDFIAFSFYGSHHITAAGGGGALGTKDPNLSKIAKSIIFWGRDFDSGDAFLDRYKYKTLGMNCQMTALQAAFAITQINRLETFIKARKEQFEDLIKIFKPYDKYFELPEEHNEAKPSWFAFPLVIKENSPFSRENFIKYLTTNHIEIRPIMCGNILRQPPFQKIKYTSIHKSFPIGDRVQDRGVFIPCWGMPKNQKEHYHSVIQQFLEQH